MRVGMQHHRVHTVVVVLLMRIRLQITMFIKCNECKGICHVSSDTRTYWQPCTNASQTNLWTFILIQGEEIIVWFQSSTSHSPLPSSVLLYKLITAVVEPMEDHPRGLKNALCSKNNSFIPDLHQNRHPYDQWLSQNPLYIKNKFFPWLSSCTVQSTVQTAVCKVASHAGRHIFPSSESRGRDGAFSGADRYLPLIQCDLFPHRAWMWPVHRQVNLVWVDEESSDW